MADRSDREQGQPNRCPRRHSLINRMGPCSRTPSGPAVSTDCINRPDRRLHPTNATASIALATREPSTEDSIRTSRQSVWCQQRKSFNNLVGAGEERRGHFEAERLGGLQIDEQLEFVGS